MKAIDPDAVIRYVPKCDRNLPPGEQTIFFLKPLTAKEAAQREDGLVDSTVGGKNAETRMRILSGSAVLDSLYSGLTGWENFNNKKGEEIPWRENNGKPRPENFNYIPAEIRKELAEVIIEGAEVSEEEAKK